MVHRAARPLSRVVVARPAGGTTAGRVALAGALLAGFLVVDPRAESGFDAPKQLVALAGTAVAAVALLLGREPVLAARWDRLPRSARVVAWLLGAVLLGATVAAVLSPHRASSLEALRVCLLFALLLPLGASRLLEGSGGRTLLRTFVVAAAASGAMAAGQAAGLWTGLRVESITGRTPAFALVGNEGVLALALALAVVVALAPWVLQCNRPDRRAALIALPPLLLGLAATANLTGLAALTAGAAVLAACAGARRALALGGAVLVGGALLAAVPPVRARLAELAVAVRAGQLDAVISGRLAPWAAAVEMVRDRPLTGYGPGTFGAEFAAHRVEAEVRLARRLVHPKATSSFAEAHCEPLQAASELGVPAAVAVLWVLLTLLWGARPLLARDYPERTEAAVLVALLVAGAIAALLWFPLQRPVTAVPLLLAAGRLWRLGGEA